MSRLTQLKFLDEIKPKIADIIVDFNNIERLIKRIILKYINSEKTDFVNNILLNNSIISFNSKMKLLKYIIVNQNETFTYEQEIFKLLAIRNSIAHSDNLLDHEGDIIDYDEVEGEDDYIYKMPIHELFEDGPIIKSIKDGKHVKKDFNKLYDEFNKHYLIVSDWLNEFKVKIEK